MRDNQHNEKMEDNVQETPIETGQKILRFPGLEGAAPQDPAQVTEPEPPAPQDPAPADEPAPQEPIQPQPPAAEPVFDIAAAAAHYGGRTPEQVNEALAELESLRQRPVREYDEDIIPDDDFLKALVKTYKNGGSEALGRYFEAHATDYQKMSPEQIVRHTVQQRMKGAPESIVQREYESELAKMGWTPDMYPESPEYATYRDYISWKVNGPGGLKETLENERKNFAIPERQPATAQPSQQQVSQEDIRRMQLEVESHPASVKLTGEKAIKFGDFSMAVETPSEYHKMALDTGDFLKLFIGSDGKPDMAHFFEVASIARMGAQNFAKAVAADAAARTRAAMLKDLKNPSDDPKPANSTAPFQPRIVQPRS
mgnify:CR=1 FL=1